MFTIGRRHTNPGYESTKQIYDEVFHPSNWTLNGYLTFGSVVFGKHSTHFKINYFSEKMSRRLGINQLSREILQAINNEE